MLNTRLKSRAVGLVKRVTLRVGKKIALTWRARVIVTWQVASVPLQAPPLHGWPCKSSSRASPPPPPPTVPHTQVLPFQSGTWPAAQPVGSLPADCALARTSSVPISPPSSLPGPDTSARALPMAAAVASASRHNVAFEVMFESSCRDVSEGPKMCRGESVGVAVAS